MPRLLATQSHVVHGYVGNKAGTFPLQCAGWDVDCINSVQYSNHTGYGMNRVFGSRTSSQELESVFEGIKRLQTDYDAVLSGYMPDKGSVSSMAGFYMGMKRENDSLLWLLDPVMGDEGQMYVDEDVVPEYRRIVRSGIVDVITPNQFEMELLYGRPIGNLDELMKAIDELHQHVRVIVVTSCSSEMFKDKGHIYSIASMRDRNAKIVYRVPVIDSYFTGVGDLFSSWLLHRLYFMFKQGRQNFEDEMNEVLNVLHRVLEVTKQLSPPNAKGSIGDPEKMRQMELRVVESIDCYETENKEHDFMYKMF